MLVFLLIVLLVATLANGQNGRGENDLVQNLPGITFETNFKQYAGYLEVDQTRKLHYWLVESQNDPDTDPLILWLNGGPACSSLLGILYENGPLHPNPDNLTLFENVFAWNKIANVMYLESPAGVGFSYASDGRIATSDDETAMQNYRALLDFFTNVFPKYKNSDFYITGESYGGVYIPMLVEKIMEGMQISQFPNNLKGIAIGNGILSQSKNVNSVMNFMYYHGIIGKSTWDTLRRECCQGGAVCPTDCTGFYNHVIVPHNTETESDGTLCGNITYEFAFKLVQHTKMRGTNLYQDCYKDTQKVMNYNRAFPLIVKHRDLARELNYDSTDAQRGLQCWGQDRMSTYLNRREVQDALHVDSTWHSIGRDWSGCNDDLYYNKYIANHFEMNDQFNNILKNSQIRILVYNGDVDAVCNALGDEWFVEEVALYNRLQVEEARKEWWYRDQIAGYIKKFDRIDLLTVKGSGHMVPSDRPGPALQMITNFVRNVDYSAETGLDLNPKPLLPPYSNRCKNSPLSVFCA